MHEVKATVPPERSDAVARLAHAAGISSVGISEIFIHGPGERRHQVSVETSTPKAKAFIDALLVSPLFSVEDCSLTSRELRAIVSRESIEELTFPRVEPAPDVIEDLWQLNHLTASYAARAAGGAILLADGVIHNSTISIVVAALFLPFLAQVLGVGFGIWSGDRGLLRKAALALLVSAVFAYGAGALVALLAGGPIRFMDFKGPLASFGISAVIGIAAGLSVADDAGRRYLIGVAASVQFAVFPVWFGAATVLGMPAGPVIAQRVESFLVNVATIACTAIAAYAALGLKRAEMRQLTRLRRS